MVSKIVQYATNNNQESTYQPKNDNHPPSRKAGVARSAKSWDENVGKATSEKIITQKVTSHTATHTVYGHIDTIIV